MAGRRPSPPRLSPAEQALLDDPRLTAVGLLFETAAGLADALACLVTKHGVSTSEFEVLMRLARSPGLGLRMTDLACQVGLSASGLTRSVDRLEQRGLVSRETCSTDRRGFTARLTGEGAALVLNVLPDHLAQIEQWYTGALSAKQLSDVDRALRAVRAHVRPGAEAGADG